VANLPLRRQLPDILNLVSDGRLKLGLRTDGYWRAVTTTGSVGAECRQNQPAFYSNK